MSDEIPTVPLCALGKYLPFLYWQEIWGFSVARIYILMSLLFSEPTDEGTGAYGLGLYSSITI